MEDARMSGSGGEVLDKDPDWVQELRKAEEERRQMAGKKIVFAVFVSWMRDTEETRTVTEEFSLVKSRVEARWPGSALYLGCSERLLGGVGYDAVVFFRGVLAVYGEVKASFDLGGLGRCVRLLESAKTTPAERLEEFLGDMQDHCARGNETYGERVVLERGDAETQQMLEELDFGQRHDGGNASWVAELTERMREYQKSDEGAREKKQRDELKLQYLDWVVKADEWETRVVKV
jgi:hypothetical protein